MKNPRDFSGEEEALLAHLDAHTEDRHAMLIYADWLENHGEESRSNFIRLQHQILDMKARQTGRGPRITELTRLASELSPSWINRISRPVLTGTCWAGRDSDGAYYVFRFLAEEILNYTSPSGTFQNGTWKQVGPTVHFEMNRNYAIYSGSYYSGFFGGKAKNIAGRSWRWRARRTTEPRLCDPGDPITVVYDDHIAEPPNDETTP